MRRQQRRVARLAGLEPFDVVSQKALQKDGCIRAAHANNAAILEHGRFLVHEKAPVALARADTVK